MFLGAYDGDRLVGCCGYVPWPGDAELKRRYVRLDVRGGGIAARLLADLERVARAADVRVLRFETGVAHSPTIPIVNKKPY